MLTRKHSRLNSMLGGYYNDFTRGSKLEENLGSYDESFQGREKGVLLERDNIGVEFGKVKGEPPAEITRVLSKLGNVFEEPIGLPDYYHATH